MRFAATFDAGDIRKGAAEAVASLKNVSGEAGKTASALDATGGAFRKAAEESGYFYDRLGRLHAANGKYASSAQKAAIQTKAVGSSSEKAGKQMQGFGSGSDSASKSLAHASSVADALSKRLASLTSRVLATYSAYKLLQGVVTATNVGIQANQSWESQKLGIASVIGATNQLADAQGRVLQGSEKFAASQQVAEKLMERIQVLGLETVATTQDLVEGVQGIIAPATRVGIALEKVPDLAVNAAQAMGAMQIPLQQMRTEVEALLSGNINKVQDILATNLGITGEMVRNWQKQGVLLDEINNRLESFKLSGDALANTWGGLTSNLKEYVEFISRGATEGLFNSLKSSVKETQSLLISINEQTGRPEVSNKVNNLVAAYERLNDVIGNKILVSTMKFADWIEELNKPENISELENTLSNIWQTITDVGDIAGTAISKIGEISGKALEGFNNLPEWFREIGLVGAIVFGKRGWLALGAASALIDRGKDFARGIELFVKSGQMSIQELTSLSWDKLHEMVDEADKATKEASEKSKQNFTSAASETTKSLKAEYEQRKRDLEDALEQEYRNLKAYQEASKVPLVGYIYEDKAGDSQEHINELQEKLSTINLQLEYTFEKSFAASQAVDNIGVATQHLDEMPLQQLVCTIHNLQTGADLFSRKLFGAKEAVSDLDGSTAIVSLNFQYSLPEKKDLGLFGVSGGSASGWLKEQLDLLDNLGERISATGSTAGKTADKAKSKIESALHSVESELNKLQMTDAQYNQWQINDKIEKLEKVLGKANPEVRKLRAGLNEELQKNILEDIVGYADPAQKRIDDLNKEFDDLLDNLKASTKLSPEKKLELQTKAARQLAHALDEVDTVQKRILDFQKETSRIEAENSNDQLSLWQTRVEQYEKELWYVKDVAERRNLIEGRVNAELAAQNKQYTADFAAMWEETYNRVDEAGADMLENFLNGSKNTFDSLKKMFIRTLAEMANAAWLRPITVQIMGTLGGVFGVGGTALAYDSATGKMVNTSGGIGNLSGLSNLMPDSWTSGVSGLLGATLPGTSVALTTPGAYTAGEILLMQGGGTTAGTVGGQAALMSGGLSLGSALMYGGLGSLGYSVLGGALGLPQSKYSGLTAGLGGALGAWGGSALGSAAGIAAGATMGSVVPVVGTIIGALAGGALGSLFGQERKTHPSVYGHMMDQGYTTDAQTYIDAFMEQATYDRAGKTEASAYAQVIGEAASQTAGNILNLAAMLPEEYKKSVEDKLESATWSAGRGFSGASWNIQNWKEGMAEKDLQEAIGDMFEQMGYGANKAFAEAGIGELFTTFDLSTEEGFKKAQTAISAISSITTAIDEIKAPTSEAEQQAKAFVAQMDALGEAVKASGLNAAYADEMLSDYRTAYVDNYVNSLEEMFNPLSQIEQQAKGYKEAIDGYVAALTTMGASEAQLAQVRGYTQDAIDNITGSLDAAFFPLSEVETQTKATMESLLAYKAALETLGASAEELTRIDAAWGKMQADLLNKARAYVSTTPQIVSQAAAMNAEFDALRKAMELAGNATADLTELEQNRAQAVAALQAQYAESFRQTYAQRYATLTGDTNGLANLQQQASFFSELAEIEKTWGKDSEQYRQMQALQEAEAAKQRLEQAQAAYDALQAQLEKQQAELKQLEQQAVQLQIEEIQKLQTASKERIAALEKELSAAQKLHDTWEDVFATAYAKHVDLYQGNTNLDVFGRLDTAQGEFDRLYGLAIGGDADAAKEMAGVASELLGLRGETTANRDDYLDAFYDVDKKLKEVSAYADAQVSDAQKQIDTLQAQLEAENAQYSILVSQLSAQQAALSALNGQTQTLASIQAQIAKLKTEINITIDGKNVASSTVGNAQGDYDDAKDHVDQTKPVVGIYGSKYLTEYDLLVAKVASLNATKVDGRTDWTVADARKSMLDWYGSIEGWYKDAGKREGFEHGGLATPGGPKMFGERGIEYGDVEQPTRIYDATKTRLMLEGGHEYAREAYKGMSEFSRMLARTSGARGDGNKEETAALRKEVRELRGMLKAMLTSVVKNTKDVRDFLEEFEETGLPPQRVNA